MTCDHQHTTIHVVNRKGLIHHRLQVHEHDVNINKLRVLHDTVKGPVNNEHIA